ncbi:ABC-type transport system, substrate-binding protein [Oscillibacter sp. PC13]|uniref:ABC transporter substrate-binding protein n=1 Tax=Oscillibacter sp. PC13 TaxID=1855299 RepID=UPI0008F0C2E2|nr:ABC transporter substrate-binding protein [Oscillibacter sp. PC13]SFP03432.1 ABC-type transport system, substrate-binding protein [Oscillibacter sp. PC13]
MKQRLCKLVVLLLLPLLLSGCWDAAPEPENSGSLLPEGAEDTSSAETKLSLPSAFSLPYLSEQTLDPVTCADGMQQVVGSLLYESLFELDETLEPQPVLCSSYTYQPESFTYTFTLRDGITLSDGSPLTAADVAATLQRAKNSERYRARLEQVISITGSGQNVTVVLGTANTGFPALMDIPIVKSGTEGSLAPVGTGPYCLAQEEGSSVCLRRNSSWWKGKSQPLDRMMLSPVSDQDTMLYQFTSHDVQLITADLTGTDSISATGNVSFQDADTTVLQYVGFNTQRSTFQDAALRRALSLGINRSTIVSAFLSGHGVAAQFPLSPLSPLYPEDLETAYSYDAFSSAMEASGLNSGKSIHITMIVNAENSFKVSVAEYIAAALSAFDLQISVKALPWEEYTAALAAGDYDLYYGEVKLTADWNLKALLGTAGSLNYGRWSDAQTDLLLTAYASSSARKAAMQALCAYLQQQMPIAPVCFKSTSVLVQTGVAEGLSPTMSNPFYNLPSCSFHLSEE